MAAPYRNRSQKFPRTHVSSRIRMDLLQIAQPIIKKNNTSIYHIFESALLAFIFQHSSDFNTYLKNTATKALPKRLLPLAQQLPPSSPIFFAHIHSHLAFPKNYSIYISSYNTPSSIDAILIAPYLKDPVLLLNASPSLFSTSPPLPI